MTFISMFMTWSKPPRGSEHLRHAPASVHLLLFQSLLCSCKPWKGWIVNMLFCLEECAIIFSYAQQNCSTAMLSYSEEMELSCFIVAALLYIFKVGQSMIALPNSCEAQLLLHLHYCPWDNLLSVLEVVILMKSRCVLKKLHKISFWGYFSLDHLNIW